MAREDVRNKISQEEEIVESLTARYKKLVQEKWKALNPNTPKNNPTGGNDGGKCPICGNKPCTCDKMSYECELHYSPNQSYPYLALAIHLLALL